MQVSKVTVWPKSEYASVILIAASLGLAGGLLEGAIYWLVRTVPGWITWRMRSSGASIEIIWVTPLVYLFLFVALALLLMAAVVGRKRLRLLPRIGLEALAVFLFTFLSVYAVTYVPGRMHSWAAAVLSLGVAVQVCRWFLDNKELMISIIRRSLPVLLLLVVTEVGATTGLKTIHESTLISDLPRVEPNTPNVLLIVLDTARADHFSCYGYERPTTPNIDTFAQEGVLFENAFATSAWTLPSHVAILTGHYFYGQDGSIKALELSEEHVTLAEALAYGGYACAGFSANTYWATSTAGLDRGFHHFEDYFGSLSDMAVRTIYGRKFERRILSRLYRDTWGRKRANDINEDLLDWLDEQQGRPFFVFLNYMDAHSPYVSPPPHHTMFMNSDQRVSEDDASFIPSQGNPGSADLRELWIAGYDGGLNYLDTELGKLFNELQRRGLLDNTLVVLTSDHGEAFGEHGFYEHGHSLYREILHVPLIIRFPAKLPKGLRVSSTVSIRDIPATITSLVSPGGPQRFPGESMAAFWSTQPSLANSEPGPALAEIYGNVNVSDVSSKSKWAKSFVTPRWHCIIYESGRAELFDLQKDPKETQNLADTPAGASVVEGFKARLQRGTTAKAS